MTQQEIKEILAEQLQLLREESKNATPDEIAHMSQAMSMIANSYLIHYTV